MPQSAPHPSDRRQKPPRPAADAPPPEPDPPVQTAEEGALFRALTDAGAEAMVAYTAERRIGAMISEAVTPQLQPFLVEMRRRFDEQERRFDEQERRFDEQERRFDRLERKLDTLVEGAAERDRKLDVLVARVDGLKALVQVLFGALAILITVLLAVFGFLFTS